jgi:hypothetical protein
MGQQLQTSRSEGWRREGADRRWLSMLIDAIEEVSRPEIRAVPCDPFVLAALRAQLARPAARLAHGGSVFSLRN